jgi:predicted alpha/beta hydrolase family esterase
VRRLGIVHRWGGAPGADWYPWLRDKLEALDPRPFDEIGIPAMPDPDRPDPAIWVPAFLGWLGDERYDLAETVLVGHSVGCQTIVRALATLPAGVAVAGCLLVAPWFALDEEERDETSALWEDTAFDEAAARRAAGSVVALLSDDDPFTSDWEANGRAWERRLGADVVLERGAGHFNEREEPRILELVGERFARVAASGK